MLWSAAARPQYLGDSHGLVIQSANVVPCLKRQFTGCDRRPDGHFGGRIDGAYRLGNISPFPLMQYLIAVPMRAVGFGVDSTLHTLILIDFAALLLSLVLAWRIARRLGLDVWAPVLVLALVISPLLWYSTVAYGEVLAGALLLLPVYAVLAKWPRWALVAAVTAACLSKETSPPFVLGLVVLAVLSLPMLGDDQESGHVGTLRPVAIPVVIGLVVGTSLNAAFNVFRYRSLSNYTYTSLAPKITLGRTISNLRSLAIHPDFGLLWFWPAAIVVMLVGLVAAARHPWPRGWRALVPLGVPALLVANQIGLAVWNTPFGGIAWGPRLSLPLVVPLVVLAAVVVGARGEAVVSRLVRSAWVWPVGLLIVAGGLPQIGWLRAAPILHRYFLHRTYCRPPTPPGYASRAQFCHEWVTGGRIPILLDGLHTVATPLGAVAAVAVCGTVIGLLSLARSEAGRGTREQARLR